MCEPRYCSSKQAGAARRGTAWVACALSVWIGCEGERMDAGPASTTNGATASGGGVAGTGAMSGGGPGASGPERTMSSNAGTDRGGAEPVGGAPGNGDGDSASSGAAGAGAGRSAGSGSSGAPGSAGAADTQPEFKRGCKDLDPGPCASFQPGGPYGAEEMELGPYGASMDYNTGKEFAYPVAAGDADNDFVCGALSGGQTSMMPTGAQAVDYSAFTVYRPGRFKDGERVPIIIWGNGTCAWPEAYGALLRYVASHGFFIVAANSRWVGDAVALKSGLDFAFAANDDSQGPYYQRLDTTKVGAMGHSQGASGTANLARDSRVKAVILWNGGGSATKPFLAVTADGDIGNPTPSSMSRALQTAQVGGAFLFYRMVLQMGDLPGHLTLVTEPARVVEPAVAWWKYILNGDAESRAYFVGADCGLCNRTAEFEFGQRGLP